LSSKLLARQLFIVSLAHVSQKMPELLDLDVILLSRPMVGNSTGIQQQLRDQMYCFVNCFYMRSIKHINTATYHHSQFPAGS